MRKVLLAGVAAVSLAHTPTAEAALAIYTQTLNGVVSPFTLQASNAANTTASVTNLTVSGFNISSMSVTGVDASNALMATSLNVTTYSTNPYELLVTFVQTDVSFVNGPVDFTTVFAGAITDALCCRRTLVSTINAPLTSGATRPTVGHTLVATEVDQTTVTLNGLFATIEIVRFKAAGAEPSLSIRDAIYVPEPMSIALLGAGLLGLGVARRRKA